MAGYQQTVSNFLCNISKDIKALRKISEKESGTNGVKSLTISVPETGGSMEFFLGKTTINFKNGTITDVSGNTTNLNQSLSSKGHTKMHSFAISADQQIQYKIVGMKRRIIPANHSDHINNISFTSVIVTCNKTTNVQLRASTETNPDMGLTINYKIDSEGKQHVLAEGDVGIMLQDSSKRVYVTPVGSLEKPFAQCEEDRLLNVDIYQCKVQKSPSERGAKIGYQTGISTTAFVVLANATFVQPAGDVQMEVVSDDAADDSAGAGAQLIRITYFNEAWEKLTTDVIMDGTTIVNTTATDIFRVETFEIIKGSPAVGTITLKSTDAATLYGQIEPLTTFMERAMHYIETGKRCVVTDVLIGCGTNGGIIFRLFKSTKVGDNIVTKGRMSVELADSAFPVSMNMPVVLENPDGDRFAVGIGVRAIVANQRTGATLRYYEEDI